MTHDETLTVTTSQQSGTIAPTLGPVRQDRQSASQLMLVKCVDARHLRKKKGNDPWQ